MARFYKTPYVQNIPDYGYELPFNEILAGLSQKQEKFDEAVEKTEAVDDVIAKINALPVQYDEKDKIIKEYNAQVDALRDNLMEKGDYANANRGIQKIAKTIVNDPRIRNLEYNYKAFNEHKKITDEASLKGDIDEAGYFMAMENPLNEFEQSIKNGEELPVFQPGRLHKAFNIQENLTIQLKNLLPDVDQTEWKIMPNGQLWTSTTMSTKTKERIQNTANDLLDQDLYKQQINREWLYNANQMHGGNNDLKLNYVLEKSVTTLTDIDKKITEEKKKKDSNPDLIEYYEEQKQNIQNAALEASNGNTEILDNMYNTFGVNDTRSKYVNASESIFTTTSKTLDVRNVSEAVLGGLNKKLDENNPIRTIGSEGVMKKIPDVKVFLSNLNALKQNVKAEQSKTINIITEAISTIPVLGKLIFTGKTNSNGTPIPKSEADQLEQLNNLNLAYKESINPETGEVEYDKFLINASNRTGQAFTKANFDEDLFNEFTTKFLPSMNTTLKTLNSMQLKLKQQDQFITDVMDSEYTGTMWESYKKGMGIKYPGQPLISESQFKKIVYDAVKNNEDETQAWAYVKKNMIKLNTLMATGTTAGTMESDLKHFFITARNAATEALKKGTTNTKYTTDQIITDETTGSALQVFSDQYKKILGTIDLQVLEGPDGPLTNIAATNDKGEIIEDGVPVNTIDHTTVETGVIINSHTGSAYVTISGETTEGHTFKNQKIKVQDSQYDGLFGPLMTAYLNSSNPDVYEIGVKLLGDRLIGRQLDERNIYNVKPTHAPINLFAGDMPYSINPITDSRDENNTLYQLNPYHMDDKIKTNGKVFESPEEIKLYVAQQYLLKPKKK
jgi:hypothetical protein